MKHRPGHYWQDLSVTNFFDSIALFFRKHHPDCPPRHPPISRQGRRPHFRMPDNPSGSTLPQGCARGSWAMRFTASPRQTVNRRHDPRVLPRIGATNTPTRKHPHALLTAGTNWRQAVRFFPLPRTPCRSRLLSSFARWLPSRLPQQMPLHARAKFRHGKPETAAHPHPSRPAPKATSNQATCPHGSLPAPSRAPRGLRAGIFSATRPLPGGGVRPAPLDS